MLCYFQDVENLKMEKILLFNKNDLLLKIKMIYILNLINIHQLICTNI